MVKLGDESQPPRQDETEEEERTIGKDPNKYPTIDEAATETVARTSTTILAVKLSEC